MGLIWMSKCMICHHFFEPYFVYQLCCSAPCAERAGRAEKERDQVRAKLDEDLQEAFKEGGYELE